MVSNRLLFVLLSASIHAGCATYERCAQKYGSNKTSDTSYITIDRMVPVEVPIPADTIETVVDCSQIYRHLKIESQRRMLESDITTTGSMVTVKTRIVPQFIHDTLHLKDSITIIREQLTMAPPSDRTWKIACGVLLALLVGIVVMLKIVK